MAIKSYSDLQQSKKLAKILPLESANMGWYYGRNPQAARNQMWVGTKADNADIPCWSLAALLDILAKQEFIIKSSKCNNEYQYNIDIPSRHCKMWFSSLLDAAFEMICYLKENNKL